MIFLKTSILTNNSQLANLVFAPKVLNPSPRFLKILNILKWLMLVFFVIDLMWGPNGITGRYIAMFLDNFSPF